MSGTLREHIQQVSAEIVDWDEVRRSNYYPERAVQFPLTTGYVVSAHIPTPCAKCGKPATHSLNVTMNCASSVPSRFEMRCNECSWLTQSPQIQLKKRRLRFGH